jgi:4-aminobutyrate aminotransferase-like enzyme
MLERLRAALADNPRVREVRGRGLMLGIELVDAADARRVVSEMLCEGWILLAEGADGRVLSLTPPLTISEQLLESGVDRLVEHLRA